MEGIKKSDVFIRGEVISLYTVRKKNYCPRLLIIPSFFVKLDDGGVRLGNEIMEHFELDYVMDELEKDIKKLRKRGHMIINKYTK